MPGSVSKEKPSFSGGNAEKILQKFSSVAALLYGPDMDEESGGARARNERKLTAWSKFADNNILLWSLLEQKNDFSDLHVRQLHRWSNKFMTQWLELLGPEHMTNYVHIIGSGHLTYFVSKYKNLYRYSQQGWESFNQLLKHYYFNNTNHGGSSGNGGKDSNGEYSHSAATGDHCRPLMRLCQRNIMWKLGFGDSFFEKLNSIETMENFSHGAEEPENQNTHWQVASVPIEFGIL
jgi:hypothetical protein